MTPERRGFTRKMMTPDQFKEALQQLGFKQAEFARHIGYHPTD